MPGAREVLAWANEVGIQQFVYTIERDMRFTILRLGLILFYRDFNQSGGLSGSQVPQAANYLLDKYQLNPEKTYYMGIGLWMWNFRIVAFKHLFSLLMKGITGFRVTDIPIFSEDK